jgi:inositol-phosphate phosphatase / L-galactose 1-phosphate phosphatase / histidinol-phosphatase
VSTVRQVRKPDSGAFAGFAGRLADAAAAAVLPYFRTQFVIDDKADLTPVTAADRAAETAMRALIESTYPEHGVVGEEFPPMRADAEYVWILDPIDGTKSFVAGLPIFGTMIALTRRGRAIVGVVDQPYTKERWIGVEGQGTTFNGKPARVRPCPTLARAVLFTTSVGLFDAPEQAGFERLRLACRINRLSGDCYAFALLASGHADVVIDNMMKPHDFAALVPMVEGAGGIITDWEGRPLPMDRNSRALAAGDDAAHRAAIKLLAM